MGTLLKLSSLINTSFLFKHFFVEILVMIVSIECLLKYLLVQKLHMLLDLLTVLVAPFSVGVSCVEVVSLGRNERSGEPLV